MLLCANGGSDGRVIPADMGEGEVEATTVAEADAAVEAEADAAVAVA